MKKQYGLMVLAGTTAAVVAAASLMPRVGQPLAYHLFADTRSWLGILNFGNVVSNLPFALIGIWGVALLLSGATKMRFVDERERLPWIILFLGLVLTAIGSSYYHWAPDNARLVWDRIPMTIVFMPLVAAMIAERISVPLGLWLLPVLLTVGVGSVLQWHSSELSGEGDLRFYGAVQLYAFVTILVILVLPPRYTRGSDLLVVAGFYVLAKLLESGDQVVFGWGHLVSGHTLKHLAAAGAGYWMLQMLEKRRPLLTSKA